MDRKRLRGSWPPAILLSMSISRRSLLTGMPLGLTALQAAAAPPDRKLKVIVTGGHPGDPEYGCGGTIARYTDQGHEVVLLYLNKGEWPPRGAGRPRGAEA